MTEKLGKIGLWLIAFTITKAATATPDNCMDLFNQAYENQNFGRIKLTEAHHLEEEGRYEIATADYRNAIEYFDTAILQYQQLSIKTASCAHSILDQAKKNVELALKNKQGAQAASRS